MPPTPHDHPLRRARAGAPPTIDPTVDPVDEQAPPTSVDPAGPSASGADEDASLVAEYGLLAVLAATIAGLAIKWASGGAVFELLDGVLDRARVLVGM